MTEQQLVQIEYDIDKWLESITKEELIDLLNKVRSNPQPEPDKEAEEDARVVLSRHSYNATLDDGTQVLIVDYEDAIQLANTHARNEVSKAVKAKDEEIKRLGTIYQLAVEGRKAFRSAYNDERETVLKLESELTEAKKRIEELEKRTNKSDEDLIDCIPYDHGI